MKYSIQINQVVIFENGWHENSDLNTWALFDFLCFFNNADGHRTLNDGEFKWVNYKYIIESLPLCDFYNQKIKKHLDILANLGLIALEKDNANNIYFKLLPKHRMMFEKNYQPREKITNPLVKNYQPPRENFTYNNNKESIIKKNQNNIPPLFPQEEQEENETSSQKKNKNGYSEDFLRFWSVYPKKAGQKPAYRAWNNCLKQKISVELLISKAKEYAEYIKAHKTEKHFIKHAQGWLNDNYFENDYTLPATSASTQQARGGIGYGTDNGEKKTNSGYLYEILGMDKK